MANDGNGDVEDTFRRGVRTWREMHGWSQTDLAQRMKERGYPFHQATIYKLEDGQRPTRLAEAVALAEVLEVPLPNLIGPGAPESVARFELSHAALRVRHLQREVKRNQAELTRATAERDRAERRYHELVGFVPVGELLEGDDE